MDKHQEQLGLLGQRLGLPLRFDENRQCLLLLDDNLFVSLRANDKNWLIRGMLAEIPLDAGGVVWSALMAINLELATQQAGSLAYEPTSRALLYLAIIPQPCQLDDAAEQLERFIRYQEQLQARVIHQLKGVDNWQEIPPRHLNRIHFPRKSS
ncbi:chaperone SicP [Burkholderia oklahomensis]|uniref:chaperone SicP n=1 Tax=Burkholderia oklahomensis TaxID=342113 RepID=UPI00264D18AC|nr:chaperone SicP [Burkholderia oklahomensis]MDN7675869.1 chaperone SicP [Burkholderia oklahomensis]